MALREDKERVKTSLSGISFCYVLSVGLITTFLFARMGYVVLNQRIKVD